MSFFFTFCGRQVDILEPDAAVILIDDIAHALSHQCRFNGHCDSFYSVAQHSVIVSNNVPGPLAMPALLHDASEAYLGDCIRPLKRLLQRFKEIEAAWEAAIEARFDVKLSHPEIKLSDARALMTERRDLASRAWLARDWPEGEAGIKPFDERITPLHPEAAKEAFLDRYWELRDR